MIAPIIVACRPRVQTQGVGARSSEGCVAIVTGASSGMGHATALALAREGCNVTVFARRKALLDETVAAVDGLDNDTRTSAGSPTPPP